MTSSTGYSVYAFVLNWPKDNLLFLGAPVINLNTQVQMLGYPGHNLLVYEVEGGVTVQMPSLTPYNMPCENGWVLKFDNLVNK